MGFRLPPRTAKLVFDGKWEGLWARVLLNASLGDMLAMQRAQANIIDLETAVQRISGDALTPDDLEQIYRFFGDSLLLEWNVEDEDGVPLPATGDSMIVIPGELAAAMVSARLDAVGRVPVPLAQPSADGLLLAEASMPLETSSPNP